MANKKECWCSRFECNICWETAKLPVVSYCGHLFCWSCLYMWLQLKPKRQLCPVCKSAITKRQIIPLYGRGEERIKEKSIGKVPPRPTHVVKENEDFISAIINDPFFQEPYCINLLICMSVSFVIWCYYA